MESLHSEFGAASLLQYMPDVNGYKEQLNKLDRQWVRITLTGKINSSRVALTLIDFMEGTQDKFLSLQERLIHSLVFKNCEKTTQEMTGLSRVAIDILKRNLFERTADVGFLATDDAIVNFLLKNSGDEEYTQKIEERLRAYRDKYTVYNEIVILDIKGNVKAHLDKTSNITRCSDPLLGMTIENDGYIETFRSSDIKPDRGNVLIYSHRIVDPASGNILGVLCLVFDFDDEMLNIYQNLLQKKGPIICILDGQGAVISSSHPTSVRVGTSFDMILNEDFRIVTVGSKTYIAKTAQTRGYQGFIGLPWYGHVICPVSEAFNSQDGDQNESKKIRETNLFSGTLKEIDDAADDILCDLGLVVLNGEVMAAKQIVNSDPVIQQEANALPPILGAIHEVGENIRGVFGESISSLLNTALSAKINDAKFQASLAIDIMDRNLYERANDCRWWALNDTFRHILAKDNCTPSDRKLLADILTYINSLYTVYTNLIIFDKNGTIVATSETNQSRIISTQLANEFIHKCLHMESSQQYCVSNFEPTPLYQAEDGRERHTYIYNAAIFHPQDTEGVVGGISIVFDSEPQFASMLEDSLPQDENGVPQQGCMGFFIDRNKCIVSTTSAEYTIGDFLPLPAHLVDIGNGEQRSEMITLNSHHYIAGCAMSKGYREYKRDGIYNNDILAVILTEIL